MIMRSFLKVALSIALFSIVSFAKAQDYYVSGFKGDVTVGRNATKTKVYKTLKINEKDLLTIPEGGKLVLLDCSKGNQYTLDKPGRARLKTMLASQNYGIKECTIQFFLRLWNKMFEDAPDPIEKEDIPLVVIRGESYMADGTKLDSTEVKDKCVIEQTPDSLKEE